MNKIYKPELSNISVKAKIGKDCIIHTHVDIHDDVEMGERCKIQAQAFLPNGVRLGDDVFIGPGVIFTNDPKLSNYTEPVKTYVGWGAKIGAGAIVIAGNNIGQGSVIGAGSVVTKSIPPYQLWVGNPARFLKDLPKS